MVINKKFILGVLMVSGGTRAFAPLDSPVSLPAASALAPGGVPDETLARVLSDHYFNRVPDQSDLFVNEQLAARDVE
jgi:hypothetical protein